jgi:hypothetical protein
MDQPVAFVLVVVAVHWPRKLSILSLICARKIHEKNRPRSEGIWPLSIMAYRREVFMQMRPNRSASCCWSVQHQTADDDLTVVSKADHVVSDWIKKSLRESLNEISFCAALFCQETRDNIFRMVKR